MKKNLFVVVNALLAAAILFGCWYYDRHGTLQLKGTVSLLFVLLGAVNAAYAFLSRCETKRVSLVMLLGLALSMAGDIALHADFIAGAALFAAGHVSYFAAYCLLVKFSARDLIPGAVVAAASAALILFAPVFDFGGVLMQGVCLVYALLISLMVGKAFSNLRRETCLTHALLALGSALFYFSDLMLVFDLFADVPHIFDTLCITTYYPAQCLLGCSMFAHARRTAKAENSLSSTRRSRRFQPE